MRKFIINSFIISFLFLLSSCNAILLKSYGVKKPKAETDQSVLDFAQKNKLDYDYLIRPKSQEEYNTVKTEILGRLNGMRVFNKNGDLFIDTNDSICHMTLRSQLTEVLKGTRKYVSPYRSVNVKSIINEKAKCIGCDGKPLFNQDLKEYIIVFGVAKFIPLKGALTDIDYIEELKQQGLRDNVSIVLLSTDFIDLNN